MVHCGVLARQSCDGALYLLGSAVSLLPPMLRTGVVAKQTSTLADPKHTRVGYARDVHLVDLSLHDAT